MIISESKGWEIIIRTFYAFRISIKLPSTPKLYEYAIDFVFRILDMFVKNLFDYCFVRFVDDVLSFCSVV